MSGPSGVQKKQLCSASSLMNDSYLLIVYAGYEKLLAEYLARDFMMDKKSIGFRAWLPACYGRVTKPQ